MELKRRILIVDDHPIVRQGLSALLNQESDLLVAALAEDRNRALAALGSQNIDLAIVDLSMPDMPGTELIHEIKAKYPSLPILVLSMHEEEFFVERALKAGASGYITKNAPHTEILAAIRKVLQSGVYVSHAIAGTLLQRVAKTSLHTGGFMEDLLTSRELEVLEQLGRGLSMLQIADGWHRSARTVESHCANIKRKLKLDSSRELLQRAMHWVQTSRSDTIQQ